MIAPRTFDEHRVSGAWHIILTEARAQGVRFLLNSGRRTMAQQRQLVRQKGLWSPSNPHGAAAPSMSAPHIRVGRCDHAIDVNSLDGGETRLQHWLQGKGMHPTNTVPGEPWHLEVPRGELIRLARRIKRARRRKALAAAAKKARARLAKARRRPARVAPRRRSLSSHGVNLIAEFEGFRAQAYKPVPGERYWTIGFGHYGPDVKPGQTVTHDQARRLLRKDAAAAEATVQRHVTVPVSQNEYDALVSFVYNVGSGAFSDSTLLRKLNNRNRRGAAREFARWTKGAGGRPLPGLVRRRNAEKELFLS